VPQLEDTLRRNGIRARVTNAGVSGNTAGQGRARLQWTLGALKVKPDLAIVALGANDMLRGLPPSRTREDLEAIMAEFKRRDIPVVLAGMLAPPNLGARFMTESCPQIWRAAVSVLSCGRCGRSLAQPA
jgi:acyl-CoA thioesterase-1